MRVQVSGVALNTALGSDPEEVVRALEAGACGLAPVADLEPLARDLGGAVPGVDLRPWLKRRKDRKLMARPSQLLLPVLGEALGAWSGDRGELGLYVGVGREPPDRGASEASLAAACRDGVLDEQLLAGAGRDLYPPLLPLRTLPNMALAHGSIHLGIGGENGAWAGRSDAGVRAVLAGVQAVYEGRAPAALVAGTESQVDLGSARDLIRLGIADPPGAALAALLIEPVTAARSGPRAGPAVLIEVNSGAELRRAPGPGSWRSQIGDCGAAEGLVALIVACLRADRDGPVRLDGMAGLCVLPGLSC